MTVPASTQYRNEVVTISFRAIDDDSRLVRRHGFDIVMISSTIDGRLVFDSKQHCSSTFISIPIDPR